MLKRKIYQFLLEWKAKKNCECLLLTGARQIGKTFIVRKFGKENYKSFIEINFDEHPEYMRFFEGDLSPNEIYKRISLQIPEAKFIEKDTLLFLDEIQHCPNARTAIKFLAIDNRYDVISSGSLLGLHYKDIVSVPVGYERPVSMYSLDFEEFLWAYGYDENAVEHLREYFLTKQRIPETVHEKFSAIMREFLVVGGMPDVVNTFFATNNFQEVYGKQMSILLTYQEDIKKYAKITERQKIRDCYFSIPRQLAKEYTKFQYKTVERDGSARKYENALDWLIDAGMVARIYNVSMPQLPLKAYEIPEQFKIYATDIGLTTALFGFQTQVSLIQNTLSGPAKGGIYENLVFDVLHKRGYDLHYWKREDSTQEIEFLLEQNCSAIPVEVKSSRGSTVSLNEFLKSYSAPYSFKLTAQNIGEAEKKITLPHYLALFI